MSYDSPAPQTEEPAEPDTSHAEEVSPADPETVDPTTGTDQTGTPVDNPAG